MHAALYARVSTERQGRDQTIDSQVTALKDCVRQDGVNWEMIFTRFSGHHC
jgi:site-specific DNA recombinase